MALVLMVIGLLIGGGLVTLGPMIDKTRWNQTNTTLDQVENALVLFAIRNNRLPCPADGSLANTNANYGREQVNLGTGTGRLRGCTVTTAHSVIPWITLGMDENFSLDGWGRRISYIPANTNFAGVDSLVENTPAVLTCQASPCTLCLSRTVGASGSSTRYSECDYLATPVSPSYPWGSYIPVYAANATAPELTLSQPAAGGCGTTGGTDATAASFVNCAGGRAAYVLISHGTSGWYGWTKPISGTASQINPPGPTTYAYKQSNRDGTAPGGTGLGFYQGSPIGPNTSANYFDDIVRWRSPAMIVQLCGSGACGNP
jgi:type II secretory pathway pseudopilin PulG